MSGTAVNHDHSAGGIGPARVSGYDVVRVLLGAALLVASVLKGYDLIAGSMAERLLFTPRWLLIGLVIFEWAFGLWLIAGLHPGWTRRVAIGCVSAFACAATAKALAGQGSCGCFGRVDLSPWLTLVFDLAALAALLRFRPTASPPPTIRSHPIRVAAVITIALWVGAPWAVAAGRIRGDDGVALRPETWVGRRFPLLEHIDVGDELAEGRWTVVLYRHDCRACREAFPKYERLARDSAGRPGAARIALVEIPPYGSPGDSIERYRPSLILGTLDDSRRWSVTTPTEVPMRDGIVMPREGRH